jgi:NAD-dependent DNA ligase
VNGLLNRTDAHAALKDIDFVVLGCYDQTLKAGFGRAQRFGLKTVNYGLIKAADINPYLLASMRTSSRYDMDGLVVAPEDFELVYKNSDKPKGIVAYKVNDEANAAVVKVKQIIWQVTGRGRIVPKIEIEPTRIDGVTVKHAAAHNAEWMMDRGIGPGAVVKILRSGGVIPKIVDVVKKGRIQPPEIDYTQEGVHFVVAKATKATNNRMDVLNIVKFMKTLDIELVAGKTATALHAAGLRTPLDYIKAHANKKLGLIISDAGFDGKQGVKIYDEIKRVFDGTISMKKLMVASQIFGVGIGERKLTQIEEVGTSMDRLHNTKGFPKQALLKVPGFSEKTVQVMEDGWYEWLVFYHHCDKTLTIDGSLPKKKTASRGKLYPLKVSFTGYRDKEQEAWIAAQGGEVIPFGSKTVILLYKEDGKASSKVDKARSEGRMVMTFKQLEKQK